MTRVAVVTGGASGVGRAVAEHLAEAGCAVAVLDLDADGAAATAAAMEARGSRAIGAQVDVTDRTAVDTAYARVRSELGPIEIVVTSAGISGFVRFQDLTQDLWEQTLAVNLTGTFHCLQAAISDMVAAGWGRIVTISSAAGQTASPRQAHYSASKGGVIALTKTLAAEFARKGITANTVPPFTIDTPMLHDAQEAGHLPDTVALAGMVPAGRLGTVDDIAAVCTFLCSEEAGYITGQVIAANGGAII